MIIDYSVIRPPADRLKAAGVTAVGRYIGWDGQPGFQDTGKNITKAEAAHLQGAGIAVFLAFEYAADAAVHGKSQGGKDGQLATRQLAALGAPPLTGVYFAVDFDIPDYAPHLPATAANARAKLGPVGDYFAVINEQQPTYRVGGYGGYYAVSRLFDAGLITLGWQTVAWSGGQRDPRAQLYQTTGKAPFAGADLDIHEGTAADFGQWPPPHVVPPAPEGPHRHTAPGGRTLAQIARARNTTPAHILQVTAGALTAADIAVMANIPLPAGWPYYTTNA